MSLPSKMTELDRVYEQVANENLRLAFVQEEALNIIPLITELVTDRKNQDLQTKIQEIETVLSNHANPRELYLAVGEQLESCGAAVQDCFLDPEDDPVEQQVESSLAHSDNGDEVTGMMTLGRVVDRLELTLTILTHAFPRLRARKFTTPVAPYTDVLSGIIDEIVMAVGIGAEMDSHHVCTLLIALGKYYGQVISTCNDSTTIQRGSSTNDSSLQDLQDLVLKAFLSLHHTLDLGLLERWYMRQKQGSLSPRLLKMWTDKSGDWDDRTHETLAVIKKVVLGPDDHESDQDTMSSLVLALFRQNHSFWIRYVSLVLLACEIVQGPDLSLIGHCIATTQSSAVSSLLDSMSLLGSSVHGTASDAAAVWIWTLVELMHSNGDWMPFDTAEILIELIMPMMAQDPSDISRTAFHRLVGAIIALVESRDARAILFEQIVSPQNPFEQVRLSGMALLREHIQATQPHAPSSCQAWGHSMMPNGTCSILDRGLSSIMGPSFKSLLAPKTFTLPDTQPPPIKTASLEELMTSMHPAWMVETLNLFDIVWSSHDPAAAVNRDVVGNVDRLKSVWLDPMRQLLTKWKDELASNPGQNQMETEMSLFAMTEALNRTLRLIE